MSIKSLLKNRVEDRLAKEAISDADYMRSAIDAHDIISFDIFDTLIRRNVPSPQDVFDLVERLFNLRYSNQLTNFRNNRIAAERSARASSPTGEVTLGEIYSHSVFPQKMRNQLLELELQVESDMCVANKPIKALFDYAVTSGKRVIIISDMYLAKDVLSDLLSNAGYEGYERLYVSCEFGMSKANGSLFRKVAEDLRSEYGCPVHFGDSLKSDYYQARKAGWDAILVSRHQPCARPKVYRAPSLDMGVACCVADNVLDSQQDIYSRFGSEVFGPVLFGFCKWVREVVEARGAERVIFFSRDGYIVKRAFDAMYPELANIESYIHVSRRSLKIPVCETIDDVKKALPETKYLTIGQIFDAIGIDASIYSEEIKPLSVDTVIERSKLLYEDEQYASAWRVIENKALDAAKDEFSSAVAYLRENQICGNCVVVDIGWHGTMQRNLEQILRKAGINASIFGCYLGLSTDMGPVPPNAAGYLGNHYPRSYIGLVETCFLAHEGSTRCYRIDDRGNVNAILYPYEYADEETYDLDASNESTLVSEIQDAAVCFAGAFRAFDKQYFPNISPEEFYEPLRDYGERPTKEEVKRFGYFRFLDEGATVRLAMPASLRSYIFHPKQAMRDFYSSRWKIGFCKLLFSLPLPYAQLYKLLKRGN